MGEEKIYIHSMYLYSFTIQASCAVSKLRDKQKGKPRQLASKSAKKENMMQLII